MNTNHISPELTYIRHISLFNSGNYAFFEEDFNQNLIIEGNNNIGKTTILNSLQLLLLPETNLKNFQNKFSISSGHNKSYTSKQTWDFYFPSENSYIIVEIVNPYATFCIIIHRGKVNNNSYEYTRVLAELPFENIRKWLVKKETPGNNALVNMSRADFLNAIHDEIIQKNKGGGERLFKTIKHKKDIKDYLLSTRMSGANNRYCIVPLKDTKEDTLKGFSTLFKSLYNVANMDQENKRKFVSEIIEARKLTEENRDLMNFNLKETIETNRTLIRQKQHFDIMSNHQDEAEKILELWYEFKEEKENLKNYIKAIDLAAEEEVSELMAVQREYHDKKAEKEGKLEELNNTILRNDSRIGELSKEVAVCEAKTKDTSLGYEKLARTLFSLKEFKELNTTNNQLTEESLLKSLLSEPENNEIVAQYETFVPILMDSISALREEISAAERQKENLKNIETIKNKRKDIEDKIEETRFKIEKYSEQLRETPFHQTPLFSEKEQTVLQSVFKDTLLRNTIEKLGDDSISSLKEFANLFTVEGESVRLDSISINTEDFKNAHNEIETLRERLEDELYGLQMEKDAITQSETTDAERGIFSINTEIKAKTSEIDALEEAVHTIKHLKTSRLSVFETNKEAQDKRDKIASISRERENTRSIISSMKESMAEDKSTYDISYVSLKRLEEITIKIDEPETIDEELFCTIEEIPTESAKDIKISDTVTEFKTYLKRLDRHKRQRNEIIAIMSKFVSNHIFDNEINQKTLDLYSMVSEDGERELGRLVSRLEAKYSRLKEDREFLHSQIESLNNEIINANGELNEMVKEIHRFQKEVNSQLEKIQISNLPGVSFDIDIDRKLIYLLREIETTTDSGEDKLTSTETLEKLSNYIFSKTKQNNSIRIMDLIENVDYSIFEISETTGTRIKTKNSQSNGTETMINLIFITILFNSIFRDNRRLQLIVPLDEVSNVDFFNTSTLLETMNSRNCRVVAATPIASPDQLTIFDKSVIIDKEVVKEKISDKSQYIVVKQNSKFNIFKNTREASKTPEGRIRMEAK